MRTFLLSLAAAILAVLGLFASSAEAGGRVGLGIGFGSPAFHMIRQYHNDDYTPKYEKPVKRKAAVARQRQRAVVKSQAKPEIAKSAKAVKPAAPAQAAEMENSSLTPVGGKVAAAPITEAPQGATPAGEGEDAAASTIAAVKEVGCKKFFPSVGMTLSVPCE